MEWCEIHNSFGEQVDPPILLFQACLRRAWGELSFVPAFCFPPRIAGSVMSLQYCVTSDMVTQGLVNDVDKQRRGDTWFPGRKPSDSEHGRSFKDVKVKRKNTYRSKPALRSEGSVTDQEIDTEKNLLTRADNIRMLKKENADLKERLKSMEAQLSRLTHAVMQSNAKRDTQTTSEDAGVGFAFAQKAGAEAVQNCSSAAGTWERCQSR